MIIEIQEKKIFTEFFGENKLNTEVMGSMIKRTEKVPKPETRMPPPIQPFQHSVINILNMRSKEHIIER